MQPQTDKEILTATVQDLATRFPHIQWQLLHTPEKRVQFAIQGTPPAPIDPFLILLSYHSTADTLSLYCGELPFGPFRSIIRLPYHAPHTIVGDDFGYYLENANRTLISDRNCLAALRVPARTGIGTSIAIKHASGETERVSDVVTSETSDGSHTIGELYHHRYRLFLALARQYVAANDPTNAQRHAWISKQHADGSMYPGYFIAGLNIPGGSPLTYHLPLTIDMAVSVEVDGVAINEPTFGPFQVSMWDEALDAGFVEIESAPPWDGEHNAIQNLIYLSINPKPPRRTFRAVWLSGDCWELRDEDGNCILTASRNATPDEAEDTFQCAYPDAEIDMDTRDWDEYRRDYCQD